MNLKFILYMIIIEMSRAMSKLSIKTLKKIMISLKLVLVIYTYYVKKKKIIQYIV